MDAAKVAKNTKCGALTVIALESIVTPVTRNVTDAAMISSHIHHNPLSKTWNSTPHAMQDDLLSLLIENS